jgi:multidrug resistance protein
LKMKINGFVQRIDKPQGQTSGRAVLPFIFTVILLDLAGLSLLIPVTPYIVKQYSNQALAVTLMTVFYAAAQFIAAPVLGQLSDRFGRRPILLISLLGSALGYLLFGIGGALWVLMLSRLVDGFTGGNISTAMATIADVTPPEERARSFGLLVAAFGLGFILGPAAGGALSQISVTAPAFAASALSLLGAMVGFWVLPESLPSEKRLTAGLRWSDLNPLSAIIELMRRPGLNTLLALQALFNLVTAGFNSLASVFFLQVFNVQPLQIAAILLLVGFSNLVVQGGWMRRMVKRFGERRLVLFGLFFEAIEVAGIALIPTFWLMYPFLALNSAGAAPFRPASTALLANSVPSHEQGKLNGVSASLASLMNVFGPLGAGVAYDQLAPAAPFWIGGLLLLGASLWFSSSTRSWVHR